MSRNARRRVPKEATQLNDLPRQIERFSETLDPGPRSVPELSSDEQASADLHNRNFGSRTGTVVFGKITYAVPYTHWYRVALDDGQADFPCCFLNDSASIPLSVRSTGTLPSSVGVLVFKPPEGSYGFILGVVPDIVGDGALVHPDWISQGSNMGFKRELYYHGLLRLFANEASLYDFSNNRPVDGSALGEWGKISDLGGGIHIDPFLVWLRISETCGLFLNYFDDHARLEGSNLDLRTAISELVARNDSGEGVYMQGFAPYFWEALGCFFPYTQMHREISDADVQYTSPYGKFEPLVDDQQPFYRTEHYQGYLGQGGIRQVVLPPSQDSAPVLQESSQIVLPGVFKEQIGLDGSFGLQSAHSIVFAKRTLIPVGKRMKRPESPDGDNIDGPNDEYMFGGFFGNGTTPQVADIDNDSELGHLKNATGFDDFMAQLFSWKGLHQFHNHTKDYFVPEQDQMGDLATLQVIPNFAQLMSQTWLNPVQPKSLRVDHRHGDVDYYEVQSSFALLPDGSTVWRGGGGEEIRMMGGNIQISCPGDIVMQPGRSVVAYGGDDIVMRANKSVDITANQNDVRLKAERNLEMMGGNSGSGRVLLESKASGFTHDYERKVGEDIAGSGVLIKAANSQIVNWGAEIYLRTGGGDVTAGPIMIDADQGNQDIRTHSRSFIRHLDILAADYFNADGNNTVANYFSALNSQIQTPCQFDGSVAITNNGLLVRGNIAVVGGHVGTEYAQQYGFLVGWLTRQSLQQAKASLQTILTSMESSQQSARDDYEVAVDNRYYQAGQVGQDDLILDTAFSFRNEYQYGTTAWELPETYWQQMARESSQTPGVWSENAVVYQQEELGPHPGYSRWRSETWLTMPSQLHDHTSGRDAARASGAYEAPVFSEWTKQMPDGNYPVIASQ